ncbi:hypothetical protein C5167_022738 [Papaver somniferum]|uniref:Clp ATPase C-terminal domain-containing protein n=1 Tax=Papaver somniferum TaxID=3469 RepID=A0A4Y7JLT6_PAPSO|nr:hypothetical protein C5167_022738 [Papaver somniferum]
MKDVASRLAERAIALAVSDVALDIVLTEIYDPICDLLSNVLFQVAKSSLSILHVYGARIIRRWLEKKVVTKLSNMLLREKIDENSTVYIDASLDGAELTYQVEKNGGLKSVV